MGAMEICHLFISTGHNFVGHHGREPDTHPMIEISEIECVAGRGIRGDRYFDFKDDYKGQITFFSLEVFDELCSAMQIQACSPALARRNVITRGVDLNELIGQEFEAARRSFSRNGRVPAMLLDGRRIRSGCTGISERSRWSARKDFNRWEIAFDEIVIPSEVEGPRKVSLR